MGHFVEADPVSRGNFSDVATNRAVTTSSRAARIRAAGLRRTVSQESIASLNVLLRQEPLRDLSVGTEGHAGWMSVMRKWRGCSGDSCWEGVGWGGGGSPLLNHEPMWILLQE